MNNTVNRLATPVILVVIAATTAAAQSQSNRRAANSNTTAVTANISSLDYRLGAGDKLRIEVYKDQQLSQALQIRPDGKITLPLVGDLVASGLTPMELRDQVTSGLREYVTNPVVTVIVVEATAAVAYVMGEVNRPGPIPIQGPTTVLQALAKAGGFGEWANLKEIRILRNQNGETPGETIEFNYKDALKGKAPVVYLRPGDMVVVP